MLTVSYVRYTNKNEVVSVVYGAKVGEETVNYLVAFLSRLLVVKLQCWLLQFFKSMSIHRRTLYSRLSYTGRARRQAYAAVWATCCLVILHMNPGISLQSNYYYIFFFKHFHIFLTIKKEIYSILEIFVLVTIYGAFTRARAGDQPGSGHCQVWVLLRSIFSKRSHEITLQPG